MRRLQITLFILQLITAASLTCSIGILGTEVYLSHKSQVEIPTK